MSVTPPPPDDAVAVGNARSSDATPRVRPLRWELDVTRGEETLHVETVVGPYRAWESRGEGRAVIPGKSAPVTVGTTMEDARLSCEADYRAKILGALDI